MSNPPSFSSGPSAAPSEAAGPAWHATSVADARQHLKATGPLSRADVDARLASYGPNQLPETRSAGPLRRLARQLNNFLIYVLLTAVVITAALGRSEERRVGKECRSRWSPEQYKKKSNIE